MTEPRTLIGSSNLQTAPTTKNWVGSLHVSQLHSSLHTDATHSSGLVRLQSCWSLQLCCTHQMCWASWPPQGWEREPARCTSCLFCRSDVSCLLSHSTCIIWRDPLAAFCLCACRYNHAQQSLLADICACRAGAGEPPLYAGDKDNTCALRFSCI